LETQNYFSSSTSSWMDVRGETLESSAIAETQDGRHTEVEGEPLGDDEVPAGGVGLDEISGGAQNWTTIFFRVMRDKFPGQEYTKSFSPQDMSGWLREDWARYALRKALPDQLERAVRRNLMVHAQHVDEGHKGKLFRLADFSTLEKGPGGPPVSDGLPVSGGFIPTSTKRRALPKKEPSVSDKKRDGSLAESGVHMEVQVGKGGGGNKLSIDPELEMEYMKLIPDGWLSNPVGVPVRLWERDKASLLELDASLLTISGKKGYRTCRTTHGVLEGRWYFEALVYGTPDEGNVRLGWSTRSGQIEAPVGFDKHGFGLRDLTGELFHEGRGKAYGEVSDSHANSTPERHPTKFPCFQALSRWGLYWMSY